MCFKHEITVTINHEDIGRHPERISKISPFIDQHDWKSINFRDQKTGSKRQNNRPKGCVFIKRWWTRKYKRSLRIKTQFIGWI